MAFFTARASGGHVEGRGGRRGSVQDDGTLLAQASGGVRPRRSAPRPALRLALEERETISRGLVQGKTLTAIAAELGRAVCAVSREVARTAGVNRYRAARADRLAMARLARPRPGSWPRTRRCGSTWRPSGRPAGPRRRSAPGSSWTSPPIRAYGTATIHTSLFVQAKTVLPGN